MDHKLKRSNVIIFIILITLNLLANLLPLGGLTTGQVTLLNLTLFSPASYTYYIWFIIYVCMMFFVLAQTGLCNNTASAHYLRNMAGIWFFLNCFFHIGWTISWHYQAMQIAFFFMLGQLITLIILNRKLIPGQFHYSTERLGIYGFQIYLGWIIPTTLSSLAILLKENKWLESKTSEQLWSGLLFTAGTAIAVELIMVRHQILAAAAILWEYVGVMLRHITAPDTQNMSLVIITLIISIICIMLAMITEIPPKPGERYQKPEKS